MLLLEDAFSVANSIRTMEPN